MTTIKLNSDLKKIATSSVLPYTKNDFVERQENERYIFECSLGQKIFILGNVFEFGGFSIRYIFNRYDTENAGSSKIEKDFHGKKYFSDYKTLYFKTISELSDFVSTSKSEFGRPVAHSIVNLNKETNSIGGATLPTIDQCVFYKFDLAKLS